MNVRQSTLRTSAGLLIALGWLATSADTSRAVESSRMAVGVAKADITPQTPVRMYGYASRKTESEGVAGRLTAQALAIGDDAGAGPAVLLAVDCGAVPTAIRQQVFDRVCAKHPLQPERFVLCNSHNHSGPNLKGMKSIEGPQHERLAKYASLLTDRLAEVVQKALASRRSAQLSWAQGSVGFAANRRVLKDGKWVGFGAIPEAPADHSLPVLRVTAEDGTLMAVVVNYACHNTTLRGNFKQIHGDWAACAQEAIEAEFPGAVALITVGCGADSDPCPHGTVELCQQHGRAAAGEVQRMLNEAAWQTLPTTLAARKTVLQLPYEAPSGEDKPQPETFQITTWCLGDALAMVFFSDEVVVDYSRRLKRELDGSKLWISAYTNDVSRYIVSKRLIGEGGYEVRSSLSSRLTFGHPERIDPPMEDRIADAVKSLLPESFRPAGS